MLADFSFLPTDVSAITKDSDVLKGCKLLFLNYGSHSKAEMEGLVARLGGTVSAVSVVQWQGIVLCHGVSLLLQYVSHCTNRIDSQSVYAAD